MTALEGITSSNGMVPTPRSASATLDMMLD
jgi:hypothetical protein